MYFVLFTAGAVRGLCVFLTKGLLFVLFTNVYM